MRNDLVSGARTTKGFGRTVVALALAAMLALSACTSPAPSPSNPSIPTTPDATTPPTGNRTLKIAATLEPASMDPWHDTAASIPQVLLYNVYETLVKVDNEGHLKPLLAQAWEVSADRLSYTFHLNPAAKFASGAPVDAAAVVANIERMKADPKLTGTLKMQLALVDSAEALDAGKVVIKLTRPSLMWLYEMASTLGMILDPSVQVDLATASAGSGPYVVQKHNRGQNVILAANSNYWGNPARFDEATFVYLPDPNSQNAAMLSGDLDIISNLQAPDSLPLYADTSRFNTIVGTTNGEVVLGLNHQNEALSKLPVRQALTMAIDRQALLDTVWAGQGTLIGSMAVPTDAWFEDLSGVNPYNPDQARKLLADAGYAKGLNLRLRVPVVPYAVKSAQFVASQLSEVGVTVTIEELDFSRWLEEVFTNADYDMTIVAHVEARDLGKFADPGYYWRYGDAEFAKLYTTADEAPTEAEAIEGMKKAVRFLADDAAAIWLFDLPNLVITKATVLGVPANATTLSFDLTPITSR